MESNVKNVDMRTERTSSSSESVIEPDGTININEVFSSIQR